MIHCVPIHCAPPTPMTKIAFPADMLLQFKGNIHSVSAQINNVAIIIMILADLILLDYLQDIAHRTKSWKFTFDA